MKTYVNKYLINKYNKEFTIIEQPILTQLYFEIGIGRKKTWEKITACYNDDFLFQIINKYHSKDKTIKIKRISKETYNKNINK